MKVKQEFKDIIKPEDINQEELNAYLIELYGERKFDINDPSYNAKNTDSRDNWNNFAYKQQVDKLITKLVLLSDLRYFDDLRKHYERPISPGAARTSAEEEKTFAEFICFKLAKKRERVNISKFQDEVKAATLDKCIGGAATNMQNIFFAMEQSIYYQKYNFISQLAREYIRIKKLVPAGNEPHALNKLIHEVSMSYHVTPPRDNYVVYRDLNRAALDNMQKYQEFFPYLDALMDSRQGVYNLVNFTANDVLSRFPSAEELNTIEEGSLIGEDTSSKSVVKINDLLAGTGIDNTHILTTDEEGNYVYIDNYQEIIELIEMQKLMASQMIAFDPIIIDGNPIIETSSGWYSVKQENGKAIFHKYLDNKDLKSFTINGRNFEDCFHDILKKHVRDCPNRMEETPTIGDGILDTDQFKKVENILGSSISNNSAHINFRFYIISLSRFFNCAKNFPNIAADILLEKTKDSSINTVMELYHIYIHFTTENNSPAYIFDRAIKEGNANLIKGLVRDYPKECKINRLSIDLALKHKKTESLQALLDVDPNLFNSDYLDHDIHHYLHNSSLEIIMLYVKSKEANKALYLHTALGLKGLNPNIIEGLIRNGADVNAKDKNGQSALHLILKLYTTVNSPGPYSMQKVQKLNILIEALIKHGANKDIKNKEGFTPEEYAEIQGTNNESILMLRTGNKDLEKIFAYKYKNKMTIFHHKIKKHVNIKPLLELKPDLDLMTLNANPKHLILHHCVYYSGMESAIALIKAGIDQTVLNDKGETFMHYAIHMKRPNLLIQLIEAGADLEMVNKDGQTVLEYAKKELTSISPKHRLHEVVKLMEEAIAKKKAERMEVVEENVAAAPNPRPSWQEKVNRRTAEVTLEAARLEAAASATPNSSAPWKKRLNKRKESEVDIEAERHLKR
jgi:ankyrin repeat protein